MKVIMKLIAFLLTVMPFAAFADGDDVTTTVRAFTDDEGGNVTKNVGNVTVTNYSDRAFGILAEAESNRTATVTAKDIDVNVPAAIEQAGVEVWSGDSAGTVNITTNNIKSGQHGVQAYGNVSGSKTTVTVNGDIEAGAYDTGFGYRLGSGVFASFRNGGIVNVTVNGDINAKDRGVLISAVGDADPATGGTANIAVYGDVISDGTSQNVVGAGIDFFGHTDKADVLVTGVVSGIKMGVNSDTLYYTSTGDSKLTVWKIESASGNLFTKRVGTSEYEADNDFAKKVNYIIRHADNVLPKKANGSAIAKSHNLPVAKEGEKVIIDTSVDGVYVKKAFNNGVEITTKDENGFFYVTVERGGGIDLSIETGIAQTCESDPNFGQIGKECDNATPGACLMTGTYECNPATGIVTCKYDIIDGRIEYCGNYIDDDCDGAVDEEDCISLEACQGEADFDQIGKTCNNGIAGTCFMSGIYQCNTETGKVECKLNDDVDGRIEYCGNNVDDDCDGVVDEEDCVQVPALDTDGDGVPDSEDVCPNDPLNSTVMPEGGCFVNGSNIPERYDPNVPTDVIANPKTKVLPPFVLRDGNTANVYYERFAGGVIKVGDTKLGKTKYEVMLKTKLKKKKAKTKTLKQALTKNYRSIKLKKGQTVTLKYRMVITKKVRKKSVTKRTKWSKAEKIQYLPIK